MNFADLSQGILHIPLSIFDVQLY